MTEEMRNKIKEKKLIGRKRKGENSTKRGREGEEKSWCIVSNRGWKREGKRGQRK